MTLEKTEVSKDTVPAILEMIAWMGRMTNEALKRSDILCCCVELFIYFVENGA